MTPATQPVAIVDIGSNSVRLVVYSGATRAPSVLFNEKVMAGLGRGLEETGVLAEDSQTRALTALARYRLLIDRMGVARIRVFATAAARDAANGAAFLDKVRRLGLDPVILSGEEEGRLAALGVLSAIPDADGVIGDLGGGSLELADVARGEVGRRVSLPLGVLRIAAMKPKTETALLSRIGEVLADADFAGTAAGRPLYLVGGSWRALARLDLALGGHPLPVTHQHVLAPDRLKLLQDAVAGASRPDAKEPASLGPRTATMPYATVLLRALVTALAPNRLVVCAFGIREGLLYDDLAPDQRARDPLIEAARDVGAGLGRFPQHGELVDRWIAPLFDDDPAAARLRLAACLLADIAWGAHPDFRAERGIDMALHGNWVAIDAPGRVRLAQALYASFGGGGDFPYKRIAALVGEADLRRARIWGLAIRLAQRLSAGVADPLRRSRLDVDGDRLVLRLAATDASLFGETVERRLKTLAQTLDKKLEFRLC